jgi:hypothetical protein
MHTNLAQAMMDQAEGRSPNIELAEVAVEFTAAGEVTLLTRVEHAA